jgi:hypothetical protein
VIIWISVAIRESLVPRSIPDQRSRAVPSYMKVIGLRPPHVIGVEPLEAEAGTLNQLIDGAVEMTAPHNPPPPSGTNGPQGRHANAHR